MRILAGQTAAISVDIQERLMPSIHDNEELLARCVMLIRGLRVLEVPIVVPRQYPKGLGDTCPEIREALGEHAPLDKLAFSACDDENIFSAIKMLNRKHVLVFGVEAHVCVLQTVCDLNSQGYTPVLVCDCIGSRQPLDKKIAIKRAKQEGALLTTAESVLFELTRKAGDDRFKAISKLVK